MDSGIVVDIELIRPHLTTIKYPASNTRDGGYGYGSACPPRLNRRIACPRGVNGGLLHPLSISSDDDNKNGNHNSDGKC